MALPVVQWSTSTSPGFSTFPPSLTCPITAKKSASPHSSMPCFSSLPRSPRLLISTYAAAWRITFRTTLPAAHTTLWTVFTLGRITLDWRHNSKTRHRRHIYAFRWTSSSPTLHPAIRLNSTSALQRVSTSGICTQSSCPCRSYRRLFYVFASVSAEGHVMGKIFWASG